MEKSGKQQSASWWLQLPHTPRQMVEKTKVGQAVDPANPTEESDTGPGGNGASLQARHRGTM
jgi:hypothetical protein